MRGSLLRDQAKGADAEIARLKGQFAEAWEAIGALRVQQRRDGGAFGLDGPTGKAGLGIGPGRFGLDAPGMPSVPPRSVPLPPQRPAEFGRMDQTITAEVKSMPPLSGTMTGTFDLNSTIKIEESPSFTAKVVALDRRLANVEGKVSSVASQGPGSNGKSSPDAGRGGRD